MTYQSYCENMKQFKQPPMTEIDFNIMQGIGEDTQAPLIITPKRDAAKVSASLESFIKMAESSKRRATKTKEKKAPRIPKPPKIKALSTLAHLTDEEKKAHHSRVALERYHRNKVLKPKILLDPLEKLERKRAYAREYEKRLRDEGIKKKPLTEAQKEGQRIWKINDRRSKGIGPRIKVSEEERKARRRKSAELHREKNKLEGKKRVYTKEQRDRYNKAQRERDQEKRNERMVA